ncbi:hypothetical protein G6O69_20945 [Pseudenhygromyxa sp. WMMC2535]|uniref:hypothetical protein n=1 Tax=Pseudenhygromyxa sp. WMMC2535 TaxID=2712867 RepID=UPI001556EE23|nr:hypothetical protein [Pseudenhygromyxa sp. WMMC2535]NVB40321.1 hypothetical protein [Pseudenhygromyxa sp. WMMC2535]
MFEHTCKMPLLVERPVPAYRLGAELAWRVAFDVIAVKVKLRGMVAAFLRPIVTGEADGLRREDILRCDRKSFAERRDAAIDEILMGQRKRAVIQRDDMFLAVLGPQPPAGAEPLTAATETDLDMLRRLRASRIGRQELRMLLDVWDEQQERVARGIACEEELPVVRIISEAEDSMLRELRLTPIRSREQLVMLLMGLGHAALPGGRHL